MEMKKIIFILFCSVIFNYQHEHSVSMFGLPMAIVNINKKDTLINNMPVSYTHLTLPTICSV